MSEETDPNDPYIPALFDAGTASTALIADPAHWINRRVETVEMLSSEETRRRVSIDFTLTSEQRDDLRIEDGVVVPISVLTKERRRNFDLRDESGSAVPVLGKVQNGDLSQIAVMNAVFQALPRPLSKDVFEFLWADVRQIVCGTPDDAENALAVLVGAARDGDRWRQAIWDDETCRTLLSTLASNYVLYAVLGNGPNRRILKYAYGDDFDFGAIDPSESETRKARLSRAIRTPDRKRFVVLCPGAARAASFHVEIVIPEELRIDFATLFDFDLGEFVGEPDVEVNRASLYAPNPVQADESVDAFVELTPERSGRLSQGGVATAVVAALLWLGLASDLESSNPDAAVSIVLAGAALMSGRFAVQGDHRLVIGMFAGIRRWLIGVTVLALAASATLAFDNPDNPTWVWLVAAVACTLAAIRLLWSAFRAPR
jgi:hypothetical protein